MSVFQLPKMERSHHITESQRKEQSRTKHVMLQKLQGNGDQLEDDS